jgi:hypothetical protein
MLEWQGWGPRLGCKAVSSLLLLAAVLLMPELLVLLLQMPGRTLCRQRP